MRHQATNIPLKNTLIFMFPIDLFFLLGKISRFSGLYSLSSEVAEGFGSWMINASNQVGAYFMPTNLDGGSKAISVYAHCFGNASYCSQYFEPIKQGCYPVPQIGITCEPEYEKYPDFYSFITYETLFL